MIAAKFSVKVRGVSFVEGYPGNLLELQTLETELLEASLIRECGNPFDPNAVSVLVAGRKVGYLPRLFVERFAADWDRGDRWRARAEVLVDPEFPDRPGLLLSCEKVGGG